MSVERRLAAKERARKARRKAATKKAAAILFLPVLALIIVAIVLIYKKVTKLDYSKYITEDGKIEGRAAKDYFMEFPNMAEYKQEPAEITDEEIQEEVISRIKAAEKKAAGEDALVVEKSDEEYLAMLTDEWVEANQAETLGENYPHTVNGFKDYVKKVLEDYNGLLAQYYMENYLMEKVQYKDLPKKFQKNYLKIMKKKNADKVSQYASQAEFEAELKDSVESDTKSLLLWLAVYDDLGLSDTELEAVIWYASRNSADDKTIEEKQQMWDDACEETGKAWMLALYRASLAQEALSTKLFGK
ncbi:MAG: hypothetical protein J5845_00280 [Lachnospiraceae bacterium]|nr:hypothetical protein [Lachnospiraceae bacterium]MBO4697647.1 hypothetical protein [Lachnospiraceae bacterium]